MPGLSLLHVGELGAHSLVVCRVDPEHADKYFLDKIRSSLVFCILVFHGMNMCKKQDPAPPDEKQPGLYACKP